mmetsp:Transcript_8449/g.21132  ORF Transcript_8449/g.21132 Transcript_8449/m.21132 type:complete len:227 (-) Transcript_8449:277-957(-)|eukprot:CAMPEP_0202870150 /NCGR_PEP_ID=MMETSP1391-20130828/14752_1 /ASSEMBLY_ACC=CAM_ASM_000867 /TAXON_ID=1034604 /ORGANISM="Chlamydomonas leiostraca, Strain SAG 11-49" /LENGTH=226 /DNA_ID=CAMNT_0049550635 /DNA_START=64 /DNA_END=744 /DNA_ORIENTATION=+
MPLFKRILLVRHAECQMNLDLALRVGGRSNESPLTPLGIKQAQALGKHYSVAARHPTLGPVFTSTAVRARETARLVLEQLNAPPHHPVTASEQLLELSQGEWEGALRAACYTPQQVAVIERDPWNFAPPGGESQRMVEERMAAYIRACVLPAIEAGGPPALVVTHGLAIKCFLRSVLNSSPAMSRHIHTDNTSVTEVAWSPDADDGGWEVRRVNYTAHLALEGMRG